MPQPDSLSRLALGCSTLARAGQLLSSVQQADPARQALSQAAALLTDDPRLRELPGFADLAASCQGAANSADASALVQRCRQTATLLARRASQLAQEIQLLSKAPTAPAPAPATPAAVPTPVAEPAPALEPEPAPTPAPLPAFTVEPEPGPEPVPEPEPALAASAAPTLPPGALESVRIAVTPSEREAVREALLAGRTLAPVTGELLIDTQTGLMWTANLAAPGDYNATETWARELRLGAYDDWRLPTPAELQHLWTNHGRELFGAGTGIPDTLLWTSQSRRRFLLFGREITCVNIADGALATERADASSPYALAVRG